MPTEIESLAKRISDAQNAALNISGGPRLVKLSTVINIHKGGVLLWCIALMMYYENFTMDAMVYTALHGSYGLMWLVKHCAFPDQAWEVNLSLVGVVSAWATLAVYWTFAYVLIGAENRAQAAPWLIATCILLHTCGVCIMLLSDAQKYFTLKLQRGLITTGMFRYIRHPNYTGEMMLYAAYVLLVRHWWPLCVVLAFWFGLFAVRILTKEASMARYREWQAYRASSWYIVPYVL